MIAVLDKLTGEIPTWHLSEGLVLRPMTKQLWEAADAAGVTVGLEPILRLRTCAAIVGDYPGNSNKDMVGFHDMVRVVKALRLCGLTSLGLATILNLGDGIQYEDMDEGDDWCQHMPVRRGVPLLERPSMSLSCSFDGIEVGAVSEVIHQLQAVGHQLEVGVRRFMLACSRDDVDDSLIDCSIVLESTILSDVRQELSYRLAVRAALLLSEQRNPQETRELVARIYKWRSKAVHDGILLNTKLNGVEMMDFEDAMFDLTREVLLIYLKAVALGNSVKSVNEALDLRAISG